MFKSILILQPKQVKGGDLMKEQSRYQPSDKEVRPVTEQKADICNRFTYHQPKLELHQVERYGDIRDRGRDLAMHLLNQCPESRELSLAITKLEECVMWANAAIARNE
jgi:hypothetical protein